jgi:hypothetical protein
MPSQGHQVQCSLHHPSQCKDVCLCTLPAGTALSLFACRKVDIVTDANGEVPAAVGRVWLLETAMGCYTGLQPLLRWANRRSCKRMLVFGCTDGRGLQNGARQHFKQYKCVTERTAPDLLPTSHAYHAVCRHSRTCTMSHCTADCRRASELGPVLGLACVTHHLTGLSACSHGRTAVVEIEGGAVYKRQACSVRALVQVG